MTPPRHVPLITSSLSHVADSDNPSHPFPDPAVEPHRLRTCPIPHPSSPISIYTKPSRLRSGGLQNLGGTDYHGTENLLPCKPSPLPRRKPGPARFTTKVSKGKEGGFKMTKRCSTRIMMIGVSISGLYFGHSMPPTLWKSPEIEDTQKNVIIYIYFKILQKNIFQTIKIFISKILYKNWLKSSLILFDRKNI